MEWVIAIVLILGGGVLVWVGRRMDAHPADAEAAVRLRPLPRPPAADLPPGGMYMFGHLFRFDGTTWTSELEPPPATEPVVGIDGSGVGTYCATWDAIYRREEGGGWLKERESTVRLLSICVTEDTAYVGGAQRTLLQRQDGVWLQVDLPTLPPTALRPIVDSESGLYVGGNDFVLHARDGVWDVETIPATDVLMDACAYGADVWFGAQSGEILRSGGDGSWRIEHTADGPIGGIAAASDGTLYAVGGVGTVLTSAGDGVWRAIPFEGQAQLMCVRVIDERAYVGDLGGRIHVMGPAGWETFHDNARCEVRDFFGTSADLLVATSSFYDTTSL